MAEPLMSEPEAAASIGVKPRQLRDARYRYGKSNGYPQHTRRALDG